MTGYSRTAREALRLAGQSDGTSPPSWAVFDPNWYRSRYDDAPAGSDEDLLEWHLDHGQRSAHSPNRFFDEEWQRQTWPGLSALIEANAVASAFDAWCRGPHATRAPHWLFEPREYGVRYPALTEDVLAASGFVNRYDHYLRFGASEHRVGHALFIPEIYLASLDPAEAVAASANPFLHYLRGLEAGATERRTSLWFDNDWYRDRYPEAVDAVRERKYRSLLEHYLCNDRPGEFDPSPWFSEQWYLANNPGLAGSLDSGGFRDAFAHFQAYGQAEGRSPHPDLDLGWYADRADVRADMAAGRAPDAFSHWIAIGHPAGIPGRKAPEIAITEPVAAALLRQRAETIIQLFGRHPLDFGYAGTAAISAIMTISEDPAATLMSLISLRCHYHDAIELVLIGADQSTMIEAHVTGAIMFPIGATVTASAARDAALICATADEVLLLGSGVELAPRAIDNALARLRSDPAIGAVGGRMIQPHGVLAAAGGIIRGDGHLRDYARDASPLVPSANFVRDTDFCTTDFLLVRRDVLTSLPVPPDGIAGTSHDAADLCTRIWRLGYRVVYEPDAVAFLAALQPEALPDGRTAFVAAHAEFLANRSVAHGTDVIGARSPHRGAARILYIEDSLPLRRIGSGFVRSNDVIRALAASGADITVFPMRACQFPLSIARAELPQSVEVMHDSTAADLGAFLAARRDHYNIIWIARTHNLPAVRAAMTASEALATHEPSCVPAPFGDAAGEATPASRSFGSTDATGAAPGPFQPRIVVDTEAIDAMRAATRAASRGEDFDLEAALCDEFRHLTSDIDIIAVSELEAGQLRAHHRGAVAVLGHALAARPTPRPFAERAGLLFVGAIHDIEHPNHDGLVWFVEEVLPLIEQTLRWETRLTIAGYTAPGVSLERLGRNARVTLRGAVNDLRSLYDSHRLFVAPARFAAGIPYKVHESASYGVPVVATALLARQLGWDDGETILAAEATDPAGFAARVVSLYRDADLWSRTRDAALSRVVAELDPSDFSARVAALLRPAT
jgi:O-antigen biosynthesis protein